MTKLLDLAYEQCKNIMEKHSKTFSKAFSFLPYDQKRAVWAVYAFCRTVDDMVDEHGADEVTLAQFEEEFLQFLNGWYDETNLMWVALADVHKRFPLDVEAFCGMIRGQRMDLTKVRYESVEELLEYCYYVASTVGLMLLPILAPGKEADLRQGAVDIGLGMQITNVLRDIGEDYERGRIYLPRTLMQKYGYTEDQLRMGIVNHAFVDLWEDLARRAESFYESGLATIHDYPLYSRTPVKGAAYLYRAILTSVRKNGHNVYSAKHYVTNEEKQQLLSQLQG